MLPAQQLLLQQIFFDGVIFHEVYRAATWGESGRCHLLGTSSVCLKRESVIAYLMIFTLKCGFFSS